MLSGAVQIMLRQNVIIGNTALSWRNLFYSKLLLPELGKNSLRHCSEELCSLQHAWHHPADWASATGKSNAAGCNAGSGSFLK